MELFQCIVRKFATSTHQKVWEHGAGAEGGGSEGMRTDKPLPPFEVPKGMHYVDPVKEAQDQAERANAPSGTSYVDPKKRAEDIVVARNSGLLKILGANPFGAKSDEVGDQTEMAGKDADENFLNRALDQVAFDQLSRNSGTSDYGTVFKAVLEAAGGEGTYARFVKDWKAAKARGEMKNSRKFEQRWADENCGRTDVHADVTSIQAEVNETRVAVGRIEKGESLSDSLNALGSVIGRAFGFGDAPLTGEDIGKIYEMGGKVTQGQLVSGLELVFDPKNKSIRLEGPDNKLIRTFKPNLDEAGIAQLKKEKGLPPVEVASR